MRRAVLYALVVLVVFAGAAAAQPSVYSPEATFAYDQRLGTPVPPELAFQDEQSRDVRLGDYFGKRPIILVLAQYRCPMLCNQVLNGLVDCLRGLPANAGEGFEVVVISFDPREQPELAAAKKATYTADYGRPGAEAGWHFLTGPQESIDTLTLAVGFQYAYNQQQDRFAHPSGIVVLTPQGKVSAYLYGIQYAADELRGALDKAIVGQVSAPVPTFRQVLLLCYDYDGAGGYSANIMKMVRAGGVLMVLILAIGLTTAWVRERRAAARRAVAEQSLSGQRGGRP